MTMPSDGPALEAMQEKKSWFAVARTIAFSPTGKAVFNRFYMVALMSFGLYTGVQVGYDQAVKQGRINTATSAEALAKIDAKQDRNRDIIINSRCGTLAILTARGDEGYFIPDWCAGVVKDLKSGTRPAR